MVDSGNSYRKVARLIGVSKSGVAKIYKQAVCPVRRVWLKRGRPRKISSRTARKIAREFISGRVFSPKVMAEKLANSRIATVSDRTIRRTLRAKGLRSYVKKKKPWLTIAQKVKRKKFCQRVRSWTVEQWSNVLFSDETSLDVCGPTSSRYTWKKPGAVDQAHNIRRTSKFGGGRVKVWACFGILGRGMHAK